MREEYDLNNPKGNKKKAKSQAKAEFKKPEPTIKEVKKSIQGKKASHVTGSDSTIFTSLTEEIAKILEKKREVSEKEEEPKKAKENKANAKKAKKDEEFIDE